MLKHKITIAVLSLFILWWLWFFAAWAANIWIFQPAQRTTITHSADREIAVNNHFHTLLGDINTDRQHIVTSENAVHAFERSHNLSNLSFQDGQLYNNLQSNVTSAMDTLTGDVNSYNTDMTNPDWQGADSSLPRRLDPNGYPINDKTPTTYIGSPCSIIICFSSM